jgi:hypothetical protein
MGFFGFLFWVAVIWLAVRVWRSWGGCSAVGRDRRPISRHRLDVEDEQPNVEALESRVSELEERLDFTERLLAGRQSKSA